MQNLDIECPHCRHASPDAEAYNAHLYAIHGSRWDCPGIAALDGAKPEVSLKSGWRSTPACYADLDNVADRKGELWTYSAPADVWYLREGRDPHGETASHSGRSWDRLAAEFGPLSHPAFYAVPIVE